MMIKGSCHCDKLQWQYRADPEAATACNCTVCRRYGVLWIYGYEGEAIVVSGESKAYEWNGKQLAFHFCGDCGCVGWWRSNSLNEAGQRRIAVNIRLADPESVAALPIEHFDGLHTFDDLGQDGKRVSDYWF